MSLTLLLALVIVLTLWVIAGYGMWLWGPGLRRRSVWCPEFKKRAKVLVDQQEALFPASYAGFTVVDIKECSLLKGVPVTCHKECMQHL